MISSLNIDDAIAILTEIKAKAALGGEAVLVLSLTNSELEDRIISKNAITLIEYDDYCYVQIAVNHPALA